jgi:hypothetical protein
MTMRRSKAERDDTAKLALQIRMAMGAREAVKMVRGAFSVSETTARHLIRRGVFLYVNQGAE